MAGEDKGIDSWNYPSLDSRNIYLWRRFCSENRRV